MDCKERGFYFEIMRVLIHVPTWNYFLNRITS